MTLYQELKNAGCRMAGHESDLYVRADATARAIIKAAIKAKRINRPTLFESQKPSEKGELWYEIPFAYAPYWDHKLFNRT